MGVSHLETPALPAECCRAGAGLFHRTGLLPWNRHSPPYRPHEGFIQYDNRMICEVELVCFIVICLIAYNYFTVAYFAKGVADDRSEAVGR
jgi:hypothetical protein